jgi:hypothetical protein
MHIGLILGTSDWHINPMRPRHVGEINEQQSKDGDAHSSAF